MRNPPWTRNELILALDLYFRLNVENTSEKNPEIKELSTYLNQLPIFPEGIRDTNFCNPSGVYMKLCNYLRFDPNYSGVGLDAGSKLDEVVWNEFSIDKSRLHKIANIIKSQNSFFSVENEINDAGIDDEFAEGKIVTRTHKNRERNQKAIFTKKNLVLRSTGRLACEICGFDFFMVYGEIGKGFAEYHHTIPVSELVPGQKTRIEDLSINCSNCHRILH